MQFIEIIKPDDWHVHFRNGSILKAVVPETCNHFGRAVVMPNTIPPILKRADAIRYKDEIVKAIPTQNNFTPLMTIYLSENTDVNDLRSAYQDGIVFAAKLYPAGATTNSDSGVKNILNITHLLKTMSDIGMPLLIHGEVTDNNIDIFDREKVFIEKTLSFICREFPDLKVTLEHITTKDSVQFVIDRKKNLVASITPHHLAMNRNAMLVGGIRPHYYCLPILKREDHRQALIRAATSGNHKFFLGTDTAPHLREDKESSCGCAGVFNATYTLSILAEIFEKEKSIEMLEKFVSINGANHYGQKINEEKIKLIKSDQPLVFKNKLECGEKKYIVIFEPDFPVYWKVET